MRKGPKKRRYVHAVLSEGPLPQRVAVWTVHDYAGRVVFTFPFPEMELADRAAHDVTGGYVNLTKVPPEKLETNN